MYLRIVTQESFSVIPSLLPISGLPDAPSASETCPPRLMLFWLSPFSLSCVLPQLLPSPPSHLLQSELHKLGTILSSSYTPPAPLLCLSALQHSPHLWNHSCKRGSALRDCFSKYSSFCFPTCNGKEHFLQCQSPQDGKHRTPATELERVLANIQSHV